MQGEVGGRRGRQTASIHAGVRVAPTTAENAGHILILLSFPFPFPFFLFLLLRTGEIRKLTSTKEVSRTVIFHFSFSFQTSWGC